MYTPVRHARPTLPPREPRLNAPFLRLMRLFLTPIARLARFGEPVLVNPERLVEPYRDFTEGRARLIIGFRHACGDDPQLAGYLLHGALPRAARRMKRPLKNLKRGLTHGLFVYGMEVPLWSHPLVGWLLGAIGAVPVDHFRPDAAGMNRIRKTILAGEYPVAIAPEGHVTYLSEARAEIESGTARFGFWCVEDLARSGRNEKTVFVPLSFHYQYGPRSRRALDKLIGRLERELGLGKIGDDAESAKTGGAGKGAAGAQKTEGRGDAARDALSRRLDRGAKALRETLAVSYGLPPDADQEAVLNAATAACERILGVEPPKSESTVLERFYAMRSVGWDRLFRGDLETLSPIERELAGRSAGEAWYAMRHMEAAEMLYHVPLSPATEGETWGLLFERALNLSDLSGRIKGGTLADRPNPALKIPVVVVGEPIAFDDYFADYKENKKEAVRKAAGLMKTRYEECIRTYKNRKEYKP